MNTTNERRQLEAIRNRMCVTIVTITKRCIIRREAWTAWPGRVRRAGPALWRLVREAGPAGWAGPVRRAGPGGWPERRVGPACPRGRTLPIQTC